MDFPSVRKIAFFFFFFFFPPPPTPFFSAGRGMESSCVLGQSCGKQDKFLGTESKCCSCMPLVWGHPQPPSWLRLPNACGWPAGAGGTGFIWGRLGGGHLHREIRA